MDTYQIEILEPRAKKLLDDMADMDLITVQPLENGAKTKSKGSIRELFGKGKSGDPNGSDNNRIDADLARSYLDTHEEK